MTLKGKPKTRSGCRTCKQRRVKCDETKPACLQCQSKKFDCPGYAQKLKWVSKYEKFDQSQSREAVYHPGTSQSPESNVRRSSTGSSPVTRLEACESERAIKPPNRRTPTPAEHLSPGAHRGNECAQVQALPGDNSGMSGLVDLIDNIDFASDNKSDALVAQIPTTRIKDANSTIAFFSDTLCKYLNGYDARANPFRTAILSWVDRSNLSHALCRYLTAAFLQNLTTEPDDNAEFSASKFDTLNRLQIELSPHSWTHLNKQNEIMVTIIMFGMSTSWDGSGDLGIVHFNALVAMLIDRSNMQYEIDARRKTVAFFRESLVWWWMGLAFVAEPGKDNLKDPPFASDEQTRQYYRTTRRLPHPLAGICPLTIFIFGKVGKLVREQRHRVFGPAVTSMDRIKDEFDSIRTAIRLEQDLLSLPPTNTSCIIDQGDPDTSIHDLLTFAEVYRRAGLLLLYRCFPDLVASNPEYQRFATEHSHLPVNTIQRFWTRSLAMDCLDCLESIGPKANCRSLEQISLMVIGGELKLSSEDSICPAPEGHAFAMSNHEDQVPQSRHSLSTVPSPFGSNPAANSSASVMASATTESEMAEVLPIAYPSPSRVFEKRLIVLDRWEHIQQRLPYRGPQIEKAITLETWRRLDAGMDAFWLDVMIETNCRILMV